jgi:FUN14 domain-containing protein 1
MRVGKVTAMAVGGGIILLQIANHQGYIKVNWDKVYKQVDKVADRVEEKATGQGPKWMEKVGVMIDVEHLLIYLHAQHSISLRKHKESSYT